MLNVFRSWFGERLWTHYYDNEKNEPPLRLSTEELFDSNGDARCLFGHFNRGRGIGIEDYYPQVEQIVTVIRDPFEHAVSSFFFAKSRAEKGRPNRLGATILARNLSLEAYLHEFNCYYGGFLPPHISESNYQSVLREKFLFIGITERLDQSIASLAWMLGKPRIAVPRKNAVERNISYDSERLRIEFGKGNQFMHEVYRECCVIFEERRRKTFRERILRCLSGR